jgi:hypothetical protein
VRPDLTRCERNELGVDTVDTSKLLLSLDPRTGNGEWCRSLLILIVRLWAWGISWSAQLFLLCSGRAFRRGGQDVVIGGGLCPMVLCHSVSHGLDHGQWVGKCRSGRRCGRVSRAGMLTMVRRRVDPRARACRSPARTPAARSRLWAIPAHRIQAEFAPKRPEGRCASGPSIRSAKTVSMIAC